MSDINYNEINEIVIHNQEELNNIQINFKAKIKIECTHN